MNKQLQQTPHEPPQKPALLLWHDDPHCIALVERIAETLMQMGDDVIDSNELWNSRH
jgi:hypothetical protein